MAARHTGDKGTTESSPEALVDMVETTTDEQRAEGTRAYQLVIGGGVLLLATSLHHSRPALLSEAGENKQGKDEECETVTVLGSRPGEERQGVARFVLEFTPPLASDAERNNVVAHLGVVAFTALATLPATSSIVEAPLPKMGPETAQLPE